MFFVALKNLDSVFSKRDVSLINEIRRIESLGEAPTNTPEYQNVYKNSKETDPDNISKIVFAEIFVRFHRNYDVPNVTKDTKDTNDVNDIPNSWNIEYFKVSQFNILNYRNKTKSKKQR